MWHQGKHEKKVWSTEKEGNDIEHIDSTSIHGKQKLWGLAVYIIRNIYYIACHHASSWKVYRVMPGVFAS